MSILKLLEIGLSSLKSKLLINTKYIDPSKPNLKRRTMRNIIKCRKCGDVIESKSRHDFVWCKCKSVAVDGGSGNGYMRRIGTDYEEVEEWVRDPRDMCGNE